jgi:hypothetical protein
MFAVESWLEFFGHASKEGMVNKSSIVAGEFFNGHNLETIGHGTQLFPAFSVYAL